MFLVDIFKMNMIVYDIKFQALVSSSVLTLLFATGFTKTGYVLLGLILMCWSWFALFAASVAGF